MRLPLTLTAAAQRDITRIAADGIVQFGEIVADRYVDDLSGLFGKLTDFPKLGRSRTATVRTIPHGAHVVVYEAKTDEPVILRVRHGRED